MISVLGGAPLLLHLPTDRYVPVHQFLVKRFDPFMPICLVVSLLADVVLAVGGDKAGARTLAVVACACYLVAVVVALTKNVPINKWVYRLDPDDLPENWAAVDPRVRWRNWNIVRTCMALLALLANAGIVAVLL
jgi:uncharacterized membrane protein